MVEDVGKSDETKLDFDSAGEAIAYISLDQARVQALEHARDNRDALGNNVRGFSNCRFIRPTA